MPSSSRPYTPEEKDLEKQDSNGESASSPPESETPQQQDNGLDLEQQQTKEQDPSNPLPAAHQIQSRIEHPQNSIHEFAFIAVLCMSQFMTQAGLGIAITPLHVIGESFGTQNPGQLSWFPAAYSLTVGTFVLPAGRLGDLYGHKIFFILGFAWFALWSLIAGFSVYSGNILFDICRAFQGMGPALLLPNSIAILGRAYKPGLKKQMVFSAFGATAPTGFVVGAVFSSLLSELVWWPWAYWIIAIACLILAIAGFFLIPHTPPPDRNDSDNTLSRVDALGGITGVSGLVLVNFAWNQAPVVGWTNPYTYVLLTVGFIFLGLFAFVELKVSKYPLVPFEAMSAGTGFILACVSLGWACYSVWIFYFWQFLEELRQVSPLLASAQFSPVIPSGICAALVTGYIIHRVPGSFVMMCALLAFTVGLILLATAPVGQTYWAQTFASMLIMPWGMDMSFPAANLLISNSMPKEHQGVSASLVNTIINYSISLVLGIAGTIEGQVNDGGRDLLKGYCGAWYLGIGMGGAGSAGGAARPRIRPAPAAPRAPHR